MIATSISAAATCLHLTFAAVHSQPADTPILLLHSAREKSHSSASNMSLPKNWRTMNSPFLKIRIKSSQPQPSRVGLDELHASGSAEFSKSQFESLKKTLLGKKLLVIDLRQEPHGLVNGNAVSWYTPYNTLNDGKSLSELQIDEKKRIKEVLNKKSANFYRFNNKDDGEPSRWNAIAKPEKIASAVTEQEFVESSGVPYLRIPAPDHRRPRDSDIDQFIQFYQSMEKDQWLHFHCSAGQGRTTTFLVMYDMMKNCKKVSFEDIIERQRLLGGIDLFKSSYSDPKRKQWAIERSRFIKAFYHYCQDQFPQFKENWSQWSKAHLAEMVTK